jgi:hypothetical protein
MKRILLIVLMVLISLGALTMSAFAAQPTPDRQAAGPFEGTFEGNIYGDRSSQAAVRLELLHRGDDVQGNLIMEPGLYIDGGRCWKGSLPAQSLTAGGKSLAGKPNLLEASMTYQVSGFNIKGILESQISDNGEELTALVKIDLPWFCGRDPVLQVEAVRVEE